MMGRIFNSLSFHRPINSRISQDALNWLDFHVHPMDYVFAWGDAPLVMWFAERAKRVYCVENTVNHYYKSAIQVGMEGFRNVTVYCAEPESYATSILSSARVFEIISIGPDWREECGMQAVKRSIAGVLIIANWPPVSFLEEWSDVATRYGSQDDRWETTIYTK